MEDDIEYEDDQVTKPECPYCGDSKGECQHVLLDYDASFGEFLSGYLADDTEEIEKLKSEIHELIKSGIRPSLEDPYIEDIWEYALESYSEDSEEIDFDQTAYFNYLKEVIDSYGGEYSTYEDQDGAPGYSSAYVIYFAEDPLKTIQEVNANIIEELKSEDSAS
jgi:hypothetical protein